MYPAHYLPEEDRYGKMLYNRCGRSGLKLPFLSLGLWHNFGDCSLFSNSRDMILTAFDLGITHFDIANNYGMPCPGSAEECFGRVLKDDLKAYRDEIVVSSKAGYYMWPGPYGEWGSRKNLIASCDQSLKRTGLEYFDIFYHHRPDPDTPLEETMDALAQLVRSGKALYVGISNYSGADTLQASRILKEMGIHCLVHQVRYNMFQRTPETDLFPVLRSEGIGCVAFSSLAQGLLTNRYFNGIPADSRAAGPGRSLQPDAVTPEKVEKAKKLDKLAAARGQTLAEMTLAWNLRDKTVTSLIIGASRPEQILDNVRAMDALGFTGEELAEIDRILTE